MPNQTKLLKLPKSKVNIQPALKCPACWGEGRAYHPKDRDVIEGYKLADKQKCLLCDSTGWFQPSDPRYPGIAAYHKAMDKAKKDEDDERQRREADHAKLVRSAKDKLTPAEMKALGIKP